MRISGEMNYRPNFYWIQAKYISIKDIIYYLL